MLTSIELNSPTAIIVHIAASPMEKVDISIIVIAPTAKTLKTLEGLKIVVK